MASQTTRITRRSLINRSVGLAVSIPALAALLAACGSSSGSATSTGEGNTASRSSPPAGQQSTAAASGSSTPRQGGSLVIGADNEIQPLTYNTSWVNEVQFDIYERMLAIDPSNQVVPYLAERFEVSSDGLTITWQIKANKKFHNGDPVNSQAIKALFERWIAPKTDYAESYYTSVESVTAPNDLTVVFHLKQPDAEAYLGTAYLFSPVVDVKALQAHPQDYGKSIVVGSGPFKFVKWEGDTVTVERDPDYSGPPAYIENKGTAYLRQVSYTFIPDLSTRSINLESGAFDIVRSPAPQDVARLEKNPDITVIKQPAIAIMYMGFNFKKTQLFGDKRVREAIFRAVNREPIIERVLFGQANPAYSPVVPFDTGYWEGSETLYPYDLEKAKSLLEAAGWTLNGSVRSKGGVQLAPKLIVLDTSEQTTVAQVIQQQLAAIGVKVNIEVLDKGTDQQRQLAGDYDLNFFRYLYDTSIDVLDVLYNSASIPPNGANWAFYKNPKVDQAFASYRTATTIAGRNQATVDVQKLLLDDVVQVPLYNPFMIWGVRKWVQGFKPYPYWTYPLLNDTWVTDKSPRAS